MDPKVHHFGNVDLAGCTCDSEAVNHCVRILSNQLDEGITHGSSGFQEKSDKAIVVLDTEESSLGEILSAECLAQEPLLNEHFNTLRPDASDHMMSRTEQTGGGISWTLGYSNQDECPICTEPYLSQGDHSIALLNCDHAVCQHCLVFMLKRSADCSRVQCPLCRQKTPLQQWQIYKLQEDVTFQTCPPDHSNHTPQPEPEGGTGFCLTLEQCLEVRAETARVCGCFEHPRGLVQAVRGIQGRCRCCYIMLLAMLYMLELSFLMLVFLPIFVLVLLFTLAT